MPLKFSLDHLGISLMSTSLEPTIEWYTTKLDFTVERRFEVNGRSFAFVRHGELRIELVGAASGLRPENVESIATSHTTERLHHFCLAIEDLDAALAELHERGVDPMNGPMDVAAIGQRIAFITDNLGNILELTQPVAG